MSRLHPFDLVFGELAAQRFPKLREAAAAAGYELTHRTGFQRFDPVLDLLAEIVPPDLTGPRGAVMEQCATLLFVGYRYWAAGCHSFQVSPHQLRSVIENEPADGRLPAVPSGACYLQVPERMFWARIDTGSPYEPLDGIFVVGSAEEGENTILGVLGLRAGRPGFSQVALTVASADWARCGETVRRPLFAPVMEGGERAGLYSLVSEGELLYLAHLALRASGQ